MIARSVSLVIFETQSINCVAFRLEETEKADRPHRSERTIASATGFEAIHVEADIERNEIGTIVGKINLNLWPNGLRSGLGDIANVVPISIPIYFATR